MRGATTPGKGGYIVPEISIHAPHAGSDATYQTTMMDKVISIHAPHAGSDAGIPFYVGAMAISIHAPHAGSDSRL